MEVCGFCGKRFRNLFKQLECSLTLGTNATIHFDQLIQIFNNDIIKLIFKDSDRRICKHCRNKLGNCYEFVKNLEQQMTTNATCANENSAASQAPLHHRINEEIISNNAALPTPPVLAEEPTTTKIYRQILPKENLDSNLSSEMRHLPVKVKKPSRHYQCCTCGVQFASFHKLKEHSQQHNSCNNNGQCEMHVCEYCHMVYSQPDTLNMHEEQQHSEPKTYQCRLCKVSKNYKSKGFLLQHYLKIHLQSTIGYYCGDCKESPQHHSMIDVQNHFLEHHFLSVPPANNKESTESNCPTIGEQHHQFDDSDIDFEMHEEFLDEFLLTHDDSLQLEECIHQLGDDIPDIFTICNESDNEAPKSNQTTESNQQRPYVCPHCSNQQFTYPNKLIEHMIQQHNYPDSANPETKELPCPYLICSKTYNNISKLRQHLRIVHTQYKRHVCQLCDKQFATIDHLRKHVLSQHQNERKHTCDICQKSFMQISHLRQHQSIHTTGKVHDCHLCVMKFWRKIDLTRHLNKHH